jgi:hypothetical protein
MADIFCVLRMEYLGLLAGTGYSEDGMGLMLQL